MKFDEAFERLQKMANGRRCVLNYSRYSDPEFGIYPSISCLINAGGKEGQLCTNTHKTFEAVLVNMAALLTEQRDEPEIED